MTQPFIRISADDDGNLSVEVVGAVGQQCLALTQPLEEVLGTVTTRDAKPEAYEQNTYLEQT
jgi:hypothetical protein